MEDDDPCKYNRKIVSFKDFGRFKLSEKKYDDNSLNIYTARLNDLREDMIHKAKLKWSKYICVFSRSPFTYVCYLHYFILHMLQPTIHI